MKLSVIIPVYNAEAYLLRAVQSVQLQEGPEIEIILVNDGSTDNSWNVCLLLASQDERIKLINQYNGGPAKARNAGIKTATGDYITFVDADDTIEQGYYRVMIEMGQRYKADIIVSDIIAQNSISSHIITNVLPKEEILNQSDIRKKVLPMYYGGTIGNLASLYNKFYKRSFVNGAQLLIDESRIRAEDYWFNFHAFLHADSTYAVPIAFYNYNTSIPGSIMKTFRPDRYNGFVRTRNELLLHNEQLQIKINYAKWDSEFICNSNEFILMAFVHNRPDIVKEILSDQKFTEAMKNFVPVTIHTKLIKIFHLCRLKPLTWWIYKTWAKKLM